jgi:NADPH:quinone reductase-like Zn-dependent oxidoreductase
MKAIVQDRYGDVDVLDFRDIDQPVPKDNEVLVEEARRACTGVTGTS